MEMKPYVLITNDDGIHSPGLLALAEALLPLADLLIVAPESQQTNMGRGALKGTEIGRICEVPLKVSNQAVKAYAVNGSPAQAVAHAVLELAERKPDYCISGINYGENLGLAFTCSGTLGAAFEADTFGIPSIAFSRTMPLEHQRSSEFAEMDWGMEKLHIRMIVQNVMDKGMAEEVRILNVNFPLGITADTEVRVTKQAYMSYGAYVKPGKRDFHRGYHLEWKLNEALNEVDQDTDIYAMHVDQVISVTPLASLMSINSGSYHK